MISNEKEREKTRTLHNPSKDKLLARTLKYMDSSTGSSPQTEESLPTLNPKQASIRAGEPQNCHTRKRHAFWNYGITLQSEKPERLLLPAKSSETGSTICHNFHFEQTRRFNFPRSLRTCSYYVSQRGLNLFTRRYCCYKLTGNKEGYGLTFCLVLSFQRPITRTGIL